MTRSVEDRLVSSMTQAVEMKESKRGFLAALSIDEGHPLYGAVLSGIIPYGNPDATYCRGDDVARAGLEAAGHKNPAAIDPEIYPAVRAINRTGICWTTESCAGHPDATGMTWAGNVRPMLRLVCETRNLGLVYRALHQAAISNPNLIDKLLPDMALAFDVWPSSGIRGGWSELLVYLHASTVGERNAGCKMYERFADELVRLST